jgi:hypothetical protein
MDWLAHEAEVIDVKLFTAHEAVPKNDPVAFPFKKLELMEEDAKDDVVAQVDWLAHEAEVAVFAVKAFVAQLAVPNTEPVCGPPRKLVEMDELA